MITLSKAKFTKLGKREVLSVKKDKVPSGAVRISDEKSLYNYSDYCT